MQPPPPNILEAALRVLFVSAYTTRNWALEDSILSESMPRRQVYDLWEAVHEIPSLLTRWRPDSERELLMYLDEYAERWSSPDLKGMYLQARDGGRRS